MGFAAFARPVRLSDAAWLAFCAWVNVPPHKVPAIQRWAPEHTAAAWERVANSLVNPRLTSDASNVYTSFQRPEVKCSEDS